MNLNIDKLKEAANQLKSVNDKEKVLADLKILEESESNFELFKAEMEALDARAQKNQLYGSFLCLIVAAINGCYIILSLIAGQIGMKHSKSISFINEPVAFWSFMSFHVLFFIAMVFGFIYTFPKSPKKPSA
jgi:hypothetical protein